MNYSLTAKENRQTQKRPAVIFSDCYNLSVVSDAVCDVVEAIGGVAANSRSSADNSNSDQSSDEAVLDCSCARLIFQKTSKFLHWKLPSCLVVTLRYVTNISSGTVRSYQG